MVKRQVRYPTGVRPLLIEETARRRAVESKFVAILEQDGFAEVVLPILDYVDPYSALVSREVERRSYRFVDREGELLAVRSDFTPMVARALAPALRVDDLPVRVFYRGDVIRCDGNRLGVDRELFQIGAEIVGDPSIASDIAAMTLAARIAREFGIEPRVVYTDASIAATLDANAREALLTKRRPSRAVAPSIARLTDGTATLDDVRELDAAIAERLATIAAAVDPSIFILQLDDVEERPDYYTGLRFRLYGPDSRKALVHGGRYDALYARFGTPAAAVGFTWTLDGLE